MNELSFDMLLEQVQRLSPKERLRIVEVLASGLQTEWIDETDWHAQLRATYGILADDPIERPPQLPLEEREPLE